MATVEAAVERARGAQPGVARMLSVDAFRGFTMICMFAEGFGLLAFLGNPWINPIAHQFEHVEWNMSLPGDLHFWDLIQPFFMFIVGVVMPVSFARRWEKGETWGQSLGHVLRRSVILLALGLYARSTQAGKPVIDVINVLGQLSFTYLVAFLVLRKHWTVQGGVALALLAVHWALYQFWPGVGAAGPWARDANFGEYLDQLVFHKNWSGSYATINCLSSAANTIFGVMAGELLVSGLAIGKKMRILAATGVAGVLVGLSMSLLIPLNKKIWTASFAIYSTGATLLALLLFYWLFDIGKGFELRRKWALPLVVVGSNSIFIYMFHETQHRLLSQISRTWLALPIEWWGPFGIMLATQLVIAFEIYVCFWLYKRKIFFKV